MSTSIKLCGMLTAEHSPFVGRDTEIASLVDVLETVRSGHGRMVLISGEPGIGKTRIVEEIEQIAQASGYEGYWGRCFEEQGIPPYWPWTQILGEYVASTDPDQVLQETSTGATYLANLVPEVNQIVPSVSAINGVSILARDTEEEFLLFNAVASLFRAATARTPMIVVLDDIHWADVGSLRLLTYLVRQLSITRLVLIGTYRDVELGRTHPLSISLGEISRERTVSRHILKRLSPDAVDAYTKVLLGDGTDKRLRDALYDMTDGNALFVQLLTQYVQQTYSLDEIQIDEIRLPEGIREVVGNRLNCLSVDCNRILATASVLGQEFTLQHLRKILPDEDELVVFNSLDEALRWRIVDEVPNGSGSYRFAHALIRRIIVAELTLSERVTIHATIGRMLESLAGTDIEAHATDIFYHYRQAEALVGGEKVGQFALMSGRAAMDARSFADAIQYLETGLVAVKETGEGQQVAELRFNLGIALIQYRDEESLTIAEHHILDAFGYYEQVDDDRRLSELVRYNQLSWLASGVHHIAMRKASGATGAVRRSSGLCRSAQGICTSVGRYRPCGGR
jgi:predicted ATPase